MQVRITPEMLAIPEVERSSLTIYIWYTHLSPNRTVSDGDIELIMASWSVVEC